MRRLLLLWLVALPLAACGEVTPQGPQDLGTFRQGDPVEFRLAGTIYLCQTELPYLIVQISDGKERSLLLQHSCSGIVGMGVDEFCENGQVNIVEIVYCSDAIYCENQEMDQDLTWDQQEYVQISQECAGQIIYREVQEQVPPGEYHIMIRDWVEDHVEMKVTHVLTITAD